MKIRSKIPSSFFSLFVFSLLAVFGCATDPILEMPKSLPPIVKEYKHITFRGNVPEFMKTGIYLKKGDVYSILATGSIDLGPRQGSARNLVRPEESRLFLKIGNHRIFYPLYNSNGSTVKAVYSGEVCLGLRDGAVDDYGKPRNPGWYYNNTGAFSVDIIVWKNEDWGEIARFFGEIKTNDPENKAIVDAYSEAKRKKEISIAPPSFVRNPIVKKYKHLSVYPCAHPTDTGIYLNKGDLFSILATGEVSFNWGKRPHKIGAIFGLLARIGDSEVFPPLSRSTGLVMKSEYEGQLYLNVYDTYSSGHFDVDIVVWEKEDYDAIIAYLEAMTKKQPDNKVIAAALFQARILKERHVISTEINQIQAQIGALKKEKKTEEIARLEAKLGQLMSTVEKLDDLIRKQSAEQNKSSLIHAKLVEIMKEKNSLEKKLASEEEIKQELTSSLKERETAYQKQQALVTSLYERERQLKSKLFQLEETVRKSEEKQDELKQLQTREKKLSDQMLKATQKNDADRLRAELERVKHDKSTLEQEANHLKTRELALKDEVRSHKILEEKARVETENAREELAATRERERKLAGQVDELKGHLKRGMAPVIVVSRPKDGSRIESPTTMLHIVAVDDRGIRDVNITLNGEPVVSANERALFVAGDPEQGISNKIDLSKLLRLQYGLNSVRVSVTDTDGLTREEEIAFIREKERGKIWAVIIGINDYKHVRDLKFAINDARGFAEYLTEYIGIPNHNIFFLINEDATKARIQSLLGTKIRRLAGKDDTVIIFYAGHGAVEPDPLDPDGDGFEKYLLPYDASLQDLYSTSIAMKEIQTIFQRIRADRVIFLADTCYSGATGGRTMLAYKSRATLSEKFFERISKGKGRVIISACSANEISKEDDDFQHGIFSFYLLKGLKGEADYDADGIITVNELFSFLSRKVPAASGQDQHPVKKGETEGELVIGRIK